MSQKYHIITYGCQMNQSDSERVATVLAKLGYKKTLKIDEADLIIVNMCSVRQSAVDRVLGLNKKFQKLRIENCKLKIVLTGCVLKKDEKKLLNVFDRIVNIKDIVPALHKFHDREKSVQHNYLNIKPTYSNKFSAVIPIMTGCNNFCTYCVVPYTRGQEISRPAKQIISEIKDLIKKGCKEIWLMGQNVNSYINEQRTKNKKQKISFPKLLQMINNIPGNFWIRFTSSHPKDFSFELINVMAKGEKITPYLNLPVQAGSDNVLKMMNRPYSIKQYADMIKKVREKIPNITISTDIIVGFPKETKKDFKDSLDLFKSIKYDMAYISEYSARAGTVASKIKDDVSKKEKAKRKFQLNEVLKKTAQEKNNEYINQEVKVLISEKGKNNSWIGKTREYKSIQIRSTKNLLGKFIKTKVISASPWSLKGQLL